MNGNFVGAVIYADDITLMGPTRGNIISILNECDVYARKHILDNPVKTSSTFSHLLSTLFLVRCYHLLICISNMWRRVHF